MMTDAGVEWEYADKLQNKILSVSRSGHTKRAANLDATSEIERWRQEAILKSQQAGLEASDQHFRRHGEKEGRGKEG
jgi:hypothetical protein